MNAARCFTGTHVTVRFTKKTFVTNGSRVRRVLTWAMSKWTKRTRCAAVRFTRGTFNEARTKDEERGGMKTFSWRKDLKLNAARCFTGTHATVRFTRGTFVTSVPAFFDLGDVKVEKDTV